MTLLTLFLTCVITAGAPGLDAWRWPLGPPAPQVVRGFSPPASPWGPGHRGVDLAARADQPVHAAGPGRVSYADRLAGRGIVAIDHGTLRTTYLPVRPSVRVGGRVASGTRIGVLEEEHSHCPTPCLHWGLRRGSLYLNPLDLVQHQVRLLPLWQSPSPTPRAPEPSSEPRMTLRDATTATGGALTGMALTFTLAFAWRRTRARYRLHGRRRPPEGVVNLSEERRLRRTL
ncbi:M23 family metallopeptidase [Actinomadura sp. 7K534]|uniref:murein hydrolase activator EnvC family protein n=1 Tax=Actinomadura sp. 7K534 TaxID=2530366 RepID=UPI00105037A1|nr:M23 family metallopeptidase [Actinomadura sp. 7K534]TDB87634.1 M23 family metallopeptidase [Actinomadura sp. 7K534]